MTMIDNATRECLGISVDFSMPSEHIRSPLDRACSDRDYPTFPRVDNGVGFTGANFRKWAAGHNVTPCHGELGTPTDNAHIESFNGRCRAECLKRNEFTTLAEV